MSWRQALSTIAHFASQSLAVRAAGFTDEALRWPRGSLELQAICAFNNCPIDRAPEGWNYFPNEGTAKAWARVVDTLR